MPAGINQNDWDSMSVEERKRVLEARGYVDHLVIQSEVNKTWWDRFYESLVIRQESSGVDIPESVLELPPFHVFFTISKNSSSVTTREFSPTGRAYGVIVKTIHWPDVCADDLPPKSWSRYNVSIGP